MLGLVQPDMPGITGYIGVCQRTKYIIFSVQRNGDSMRLPGALFYFDGDCGTEATLDVIRQNFISQLSQSDYQSVSSTPASAPSVSSFRVSSVALTS